MKCADSGKLLVCRLSVVELVALLQLLLLVQPQLLVAVRLQLQ
jgi:hypothetical protein